MTKKQQKVIRELKKENKNWNTALKGVLKEIELRDKLGKKIFKDTSSEIEKRIKNCNPSVNRKLEDRKEKNRRVVDGINELKRRGVLE